MGKRLICLLLVLCLAPGLVWSAAFQLFNEGSARVMSLGAAVTARTDMVESAWYNPSAAVFFKAPEGMVGLSMVIPSITFNNDQGPDYEMINRVHPLPYIYAVCPLSKRWATSFSFNLPYGLTTDWDSNWPGRYDAIYTSLKTYFLTPSLAYKILPGLSISLGPQIVYADAKMEKAYQVVTNPNPLTLQDVKTKLTGNDWSLGWQVSMTWKPVPYLVMAAIYRSQVDLDLDGSVSYEQVPASAYFLVGNTLVPAVFRAGEGRVLLTLPDTLQVGISTNVFTRWLLSFDVLWSGWSAYDKLHYEFQYLPYLGTSGSRDQLKNWHDVVAFRLGAEYQVDAHWHLRFGYVYDPSPIDDNTRGPELPTNDRQLFNLGLGYQKGSFRVDASYTYLLMQDTHPAPVGSAANQSGLVGTYQGDVHILGLDFAWRF